jgi:hypothetical protein
MPILEKHYAAMAAVLTGDELVWRLEHLPMRMKQTPFDKAILREAELRGLIERTLDGSVQYARRGNASVA